MRHHLAALLGPVASLALALTMLPAQGPAGRVFVATFGGYPGFPGSAGIYAVDPLPTPQVQLLQGLPPELTATCCRSAGTNAVVRIPGTSLLAASSIVLNGGTTKVFVLDSSRSPVATVASLTLGNIGFDGGVNAIVPLSGPELLLGYGPATYGLGANQPVLRWNWSTGSVIPVPLPQPYPLGNMCNAAEVAPDGGTAILGLRRNNAFGTRMLWDLVALDLATSGVSMIASLPAGEFPTQMAWDCQGDLQVVTAQFPLELQAGRILTVRSGPSGWRITGSRVHPGLANYNAIAVDPASCTTILNPIDVTGPVFTSHLYLDAGSGPALWTTGPPTGWGAVAGVALQPNPELLEAPSGQASANWAYAPFPGGLPITGNAGSTLALRSGPGPGLAVALVDFARTAWPAVFGLQWFLPASAVALPALALPDPQWALPLPNSPGLVGRDVFAQAVVLAGAEIGASELLRFTLR